MIKVSVLGGGKEVGRSGFEIKGEDVKILLDYGIMIRENRPLFPMPTNVRDLDAIIITHAHLDHSGSAPMFYVSYSPKLYMTGITKELTDLLIRDLLHLSSYFLPFEILELKLMVSRAKIIKKEINLKEAKIRALSSGHIPGSISILIELNGKRIWYSGDINTRSTALLNEGEIPKEEIDLAIIESTYGLTDHPPREESERKLIEVLNETIEGGGRVLIPAFSVGRSQEILCVLQKYNFKYSIAIDGMSRSATKIIANWPNELKSPKLLRKAMSRTFWIRSQKDRNKVLEKPGVIISSSGLLTGGPSTYYMEYLRNRPEDCVVLVSYQIPGTPGRILLDEGTYGPQKEKVKCKVEWIDFSSHCGRKELIEIVKSLRGNPKVLCVHGEPESCSGLADQIKMETGLDAIAP
ncbi:MAG: MBL fold metallo-hydrolase, partial [Candidatus Methanomethyliaceae archaeon]|nr:MBL fold metallo-hydrolase [Candidatus Methanomethyliaceae archaeon]